MADDSTLPLFWTYQWLLRTNDGLDQGEFYQNQYPRPTAG